MLVAMAADCGAESGEKVAFCCPFCVRSLPATCASQAHAPSKHLGGHVVTLLCRHCNEGLSRLYEAAVVPELKGKGAARSGERSLTLRVGSGEPGRSPLKVPATLRSWAGRPSEFHIGPARGNDATKRRWREEVEIIGRTGRGTLSGTTASVTQHRRAVLAWAFQAAAGKLGFRFALSPAGRLVADSLADPASTALGENFRLLVDPATPGVLAPVYPVTWSTWNSPARTDAWGWRFGEWIALMPLPWDGAGSIYQRLDTLAAAGSPTFGHGGEASDDLLAALFDSTHAW
jgi:hypothetical protein